MLQGRCYRLLQCHNYSCCRAIRGADAVRQLLQADVPRHLQLLQGRRGANAARQLLQAAAVPRLQLLQGRQGANAGRQLLQAAAE